VGEILFLSLSSKHEIMIEDSPIFGPASAWSVIFGGMTDEEGN
jgi:hypothetical protein